MFIHFKVYFILRLYQASYAWMPEFIHFEVYKFLCVTCTGRTRQGTCATFIIKIHFEVYRSTRYRKHTIHFEVYRDNNNSIWYRKEVIRMKCSSGYHVLMTNTGDDATCICGDLNQNAICYTRSNHMCNLLPVRLCSSNIANLFSGEKQIGDPYRVVQPLVKY